MLELSRIVFIIFIQFSILNEFHSTSHLNDTAESVYNSSLANKNSTSLESKFGCTTCQEWLFVVFAASVSFLSFFLALLVLNFLFSLLFRMFKCLQHDSVCLSLNRKLDMPLLLQRVKSPQNEHRTRRSDSQNAYIERKISQEELSDSFLSNQRMENFYGSSQAECNDQPADSIELARPKVAFLNELTSFIPLSKKEQRNLKMENVFIPIKERDEREKNEDLLEGEMNDEANCLIQEVFTELEQIEQDLTKSLYELSCLEKQSLHVKD